MRFFTFLPFILLNFAQGSVASNVKPDVNKWKAIFFFLMMLGFLSKSQDLLLQVAIAKFWRYPIRHRVIFVSALEWPVYV